MWEPHTRGLHGETDWPVRNAAAAAADIMVDQCAVSCHIESGCRDPHGYASLSLPPRQQGAAATDIGLD